MQFNHNCFNWAVGWQPCTEKIEKLCISLSKLNFDYLKENVKKRFDYF